MCVVALAARAWQCWPQLNIKTKTLTKQIINNKLLICNPNILDVKKWNVFKLDLYPVQL